MIQSASNEGLAVSSIPPVDSVDRAIQRARRLLPFFALATIPFCVLCLYVAISDLRDYPGVDLRPKVAGARALAVGIDPYEPNASAQPGEYFKSNTVPNYTSALLALFIPLSGLPFETQRTIYFWLDWVLAAGAFYLTQRAFCMRRERVYFFWIVYAIFILCSYSFRFHLERGQYYMLLLFLTSYAAASIQNSWTSWPSCVPVALLLLIRPTYLLILPVAFACLGARKWSLRVISIAIVMFTMTLHYGGIQRWIEFVQVVHAVGAQHLETSKTLCCVPRRAPDYPAHNVIEKTDFAKMLPPHAVNGTFVGMVSLGFVHASREYPSVCGLFSTKWIARVSYVFIGLILTGGLAVIRSARNRIVSRNVLIAFMVLWPLILEIFGPERYFYTAVVEVLPLSMLVLDRDVFRHESRSSAGICRWLSLLALGVLPPAIFQLLPYMRFVSSLMSVLISLVLPVSLAMFCVYTVLTSPKCIGDVHV
jgi:hypothetical protein